MEHTLKFALVRRLIDFDYHGDRMYATHFDPPAIAAVAFDRETGKRLTSALAGTRAQAIDEIERRLLLRQLRAHLMTEGPA